MKGGRFSLGVSAALFVALAISFASAYTANSDGVSFNCTSCADCTDAINDDSRDIIYLIADINNFTGTCFNDPENFTNKTFDCLGHTIDGDATYDLDDLVFLLLGKSNNTIRDCTITEFAAPVYTIGSNMISVLYNRFTSNGANVAFVLGSGNNVSYNDFRDNVAIGVFANGTTDTSFTHNTIENCTGTFLTFDDMCYGFQENTDLTFAYNRVRYGNGVVGLNQRLVFEHNDLAGSQIGLFAIGDTDISVRDNNFSNSTEFCIEGFLMPYFPIARNRFFNCSTGFNTGFASGVYNTTIVNNTFIDNGWAISLNPHDPAPTNGTFNNTISGNTFIGNHWGVYLGGNGTDAPAYDNEISDNTFEDNDYGIYIGFYNFYGSGTIHGDCQDNTIKDNRFANNRWAYRLYEDNYYGYYNRTCLEFTDNSFVDNEVPMKNIVVNQFNSFNLSVYSLHGENCTTFTYDVLDVNPQEALTFAKSFIYLYLNDVLSRRGMYSTRINITACDGNSITQRYFLFKGYKTLVLPPLYFRGPPTALGVLTRDRGNLTYEAPTIPETLSCCNWFIARPIIRPGVFLPHYILRADAYATVLLGTPPVDAKTFFGFMRHFYTSLNEDRLFARADLGPYFTLYPNITMSGEPAWEELIMQFISPGNYPFLDTTPGDPSYVNLTIAVTDLLDVLNMSDISTQILSVTQQNSGILVQADGEGIVNLTVNMTSAARRYVYYDGVCDSPDCPYEQTGSVIEMLPDLGSEHDILISTVPCPEEEEEEDEDRGRIEGYVFFPAAGVPTAEFGCTTDDDCADNEYCSNRTCLSVVCPCGLVSGHACTPYECCADSDCPEDEVCIDHVCVEKPEEEPEAKPLPPKPEEKPPVKAPEAPADMTWLWVLLLVILVAAALLIAGRREPKKRSGKRSKKGSLRTV